MEMLLNDRYQIDLQTPNGLQCNIMLEILFQDDNIYVNISSQACWENRMIYSYEMDRLVEEIFTNDFLGDLRFLGIEEKTISNICEIKTENGKLMDISITGDVDMKNFNIRKLKSFYYIAKINAKHYH